jgi:hypothetical protein
MHRARVNTSKPTLRRAYFPLQVKNVERGRAVNGDPESFATVGTGFEEAGNREQGTGNREQGTGSGEQSP